MCCLWSYFFHLPHPSPARSFTWATLFPWAVNVARHSAGTSNFPPGCPTNFDLLTKWINWVMDGRGHFFFCCLDPPLGESIRLWRRNAAAVWQIWPNGNFEPFKYVGKTRGFRRFELMWRAVFPWNGAWVVEIRDAAEWNLIYWPFYLRYLDSFLNFTHEGQLQK